jgi:hypothetical protein
MRDALLQEGPRQLRARIEGYRAQMERRTGLPSRMWPKPCPAWVFVGRAGLSPRGNCSR